MWLPTAASLLLHHSGLHPCRRGGGSDLLALCDTQDLGAKASGRSCCMSSMEFLSHMSSGTEGTGA